MLPQMTPRFQAFIAPADPSRQVWRLALGLVIAIAIYVAVVLLVTGISAGVLREQGQSFPATNPAGHQFITPVDLLILLFSFIGVYAGLWVALKLVHKRAFAGLFGPSPGLALRQAWMATHIVVPLFSLFLLIGIIIAPPTAQIGFFDWLKWMPLALPMLLLQTSAEEIFFRGYLLQQLAARFSSRWIWMVLPSVLFGLGHYDSAELGDNAWLAVADTAIIGIVAADMTARTGTLGPAIAFHFINNFFAMFLMSVEGSMSGLALYTAPYSAADSDTIGTYLVVDIVSNLVLYMIYARMMTRRGL